MMAQKVQIKGIREGLLVQMGESAWEDARAALLEHVDQQADFLKGARLALDVGNHVLKAVDLGQLRDALSDRGLVLWAVVSNSPTTEQTAQTLGLATRITRARPERTSQAADTNLQGGEEAVLVRRTLRSGFRLNFPGHIVIIGDVNPGAEVIAGGDVIVWGRLRGMVHAGAGGNEDAIVCALEMAPTQLRIAGEIATTPAQRRGKPQPETVGLVEGQVVAQAWNPKAR